MMAFVDIVKRKGIIGFSAHLSSVALGRILSLMKVIWLRFCGVSIAHNAYLSWRNAFFQSHKNHIVIEKNVRFGKQTRLDAGFGGKIIVHDDVLIDDNCFITAQNHIEIGRHVQVSAYCFITDFNHNFLSRNIPINAQGCTTNPVIIEDDVWLGAHSIILPGVRVGKGAVVGAGSVVTKSVRPYTVVAGNPAKEIKKRP